MTLIGGDRDVPRIGQQAANLMFADDVLLGAGFELAAVQYPTPGDPLHPTRVVLITIAGLHNGSSSEAAVQVAMPVEMAAAIRDQLVAQIPFTDDDLAEMVTARGVPVEQPLDSVQPSVVAP